MVIVLNCAVCPEIFTETVEPDSVIPPAAVPPAPTNAMIVTKLDLGLSVVIAIQNEPDRLFEMEALLIITVVALVYAASLLTQRPVV